MKKREIYAPVMKTCVTADLLQQRCIGNLTILALLKGYKTNVYGLRHNFCAGNVFHEKYKSL